MDSAAQVKPSRHGAAPQSRTGQCHDLIQGCSDVTKYKHHHGTKFLHRSTENAIPARHRTKNVRNYLKLKILIVARGSVGTKVYYMKYICEGFLHPS